MIALLITDQGDVYAPDVDTSRIDVFRDLVDSIDDAARLDFPELGLSAFYDTHGLRDGRHMNLPATTLLYGSGRRPVHALTGPVVLLGLTVDGDTVDVPDDLLSLFTKGTP